jgi:hypothetical protein
MSSVFRSGLFALLSIALSLLLAEVIVRNVSLTMRVQHIAIDEETAAREKLEFAEKEGVFLWRILDGRENADCGAEDPNALHVVVLGDSIAFGSGVPPEATFSSLLGRQLSTAKRTVCFHNYAVPGSGFIHQSLLGKEAIQRHSPDLVIWTLWSSSIGRYWVFGDTAYELSSFSSDGGGIPNSPIFDPLNRFLFRNSALYRYAVTTLADSGDMSEAWRKFTRDEFTPRLDAIRESSPDMPLIFMNCPPLHMPFATQVYRRKTGDPEWERHVRKPIQPVLAERDIELIHLDEALVGQPIEEVRVDPCCHFNERGMGLIADILRPRVEALLPATDRP